MAKEICPTCGQPIKTTVISQLYSLVLEVIASSEDPLTESEVARKVGVSRQYINMVKKKYSLEGAFRNGHVVSELVHLRCYTCSKEFFKRKAEISKVAKHHFCSKKCSAKHYRRSQEYYRFYKQQQQEEVDIVP